MIPRQPTVRSIARVLLVALASTMVIASCSTGRIYITNPDLDGAVRRTPATRELRAGIRSVPRMESNIYQDAFERAFEEGLRTSGLFKSVVRDDFEESDVDVVLRVAKANLSYRRQVNAAYFPLALATLTMYIWVGGPIQTDVQYYDATVTGEDSLGNPLFTASSRVKASHWINLYSSERGDLACRGADAAKFVADLVAKVGAGVGEARLASARIGG